MESTAWPAECRAVWLPLQHQEGQCPGQELPHPSSGSWVPSCSLEGWRDGGMGMEGWSDGDGAMQGGCNGAGSAATCSSSRLRSPRPGHPCPPLRFCCFVFKPVIVFRLFSFKMMFRSSPLKQSLSLPMGREYQRGFSLFLCFPLQAWCCFVHKLARLQINK